jgi:hypothetical protein
MEYTTESIILASIMFVIFVTTVVYEYKKSKQATEGFDNTNPMLIPFDYLGEWVEKMGDILTIYVDKIMRLPILIFDKILVFFKMAIDFACSYSPGLETLRRTLLAGRETYSHPII